MDRTYINVTAPESTQDDAEDLELSKRCAYLMHALRMRLTTRYDIERELEAMLGAKRERARHWLNHYREMAKNEN